MICSGFSLLIENQRHDAIVRCNLFDVKHDESHRTINDEKHDERNDPLVPTGVPFTILHLDGNEQISNTAKMVSFFLILIDLSVNIFRCTRTQVKMLVRQLTADKSTATSDATDVPPFLDVDAVLFHRRDLSCR